MLKSKAREEALSDLVQMRSALAGFLAEMAGRRFGPCHPS